jgi:pantoate--beta-alanine ligase
MQVFTTIKTLKEALQSTYEDKIIGFVPTMGALHDGHLSLVKNANNTTEVTVVSIFVNPTQFDNSEDLVNYPSTLQNDLYLLEKTNCDIVFIPNVDEIYKGITTSQHFDFDGLENVMEGEHRAGHFDGVGTIVKRLFEIVTPNFAFFGEKDFQQLQIIKKMVEKEKLDVKIIGNPIFREPDGLAMSSRNTRLTKEYRAAAPFIRKTLLETTKIFGMKSALDVTEYVIQVFDKHPLLELEYFTIADEANLLTRTNIESDKHYRGFIAVYAGKIRLIDNISLQ